jgi:hypothetical protein
MELLKFNQHGQWELIKADSEFKGEPDQDYMSYHSSSKDGQLPQDYGNKGALHGTTGKAKKQTSEEKMKAKVPTPVSSSYADNHPGQRAID